jgi:hypothetical protein
VPPAFDQYFKARQSKITYQVENCAGQNAINGKIDASLHANQTGHSKIINHGFLESTQEFGG